MKAAILSVFVIALMLSGCAQKSETSQTTLYQQLQEAEPVLDHIVQDFDTGAIYRLGIKGNVVETLEKNAGKIRGFDLKDSILAWCSDSSAITILNRNNGKHRLITFKDSIRVHHDVVVHYPFITALYNTPLLKPYKEFEIIDDGIVRIDLRNDERKFWSIQSQSDSVDFPPSLAKGNKMNAHSNSVDVDSDGNYYISFRDISQVWKLSANMSKVIYRAGNGTDFKGQHSVDIIRPDNFFLFDNGSTGRDKEAHSRIIRVSVDPNTKNYSVRNILSLPDSLSTIRMGSVQALGDRLSVSVFNAGFHVLEIDTTGKVHNHLFHLKSHAIKVLPQLADK